MKVILIVLVDLLNGKGFKTLSLLLTLSSITYAQTIKSNLYSRDTLKVDTVTVIGAIFQLKNHVVNPKDTFDIKRKAELDEMLKIYDLKKDIIIESINTLPLGVDKADRILKKDKFLKQFNRTEILVSYEFGQYREFNALFEPSFEIHRDNEQRILVSCSKDQLELLRAFESNETMIVFKLKYIGDFSPPMKVCQLISFKILENK